MWIVVKNILIVVSIIITGTFIYNLITLSLSVKRYTRIYKNDKYFPEWKKEFKNNFIGDWITNSIGVIMSILVICFVLWVFNVFIFYFEYH